jgi:hypothetical protein
MNVISKKFGEVSIEIDTNTRSSVDAYASKGWKENGDELDDSELDYLTDEFSAEIQEYAVENLGCYYD